MYLLSAQWYLWCPGPLWAKVVKFSYNAINLSCLVCWPCQFSRNAMISLVERPCKALLEVPCIVEYIFPLEHIKVSITIVVDISGLKSCFPAKVVNYVGIFGDIWICAPKWPFKTVNGKSLWTNRLTKILDWTIFILICPYPCKVNHLPRAQKRERRHGKWMLWALS